MPHNINIFYRKPNVVFSERVFKSHRHNTHMKIAISKYDLVGIYRKNRNVPVKKHLKRINTCVLTLDYVMLLIS